jgi:hypothetical protein
VGAIGLAAAGFLVAAGVTSAAGSIGSASPSPSASAAVFAGGIEDLSVVELFREPNASIVRANYANLCAPGALRVALAFAGNYPGWSADPGYWPGGTYTDRFVPVEDRNGVVLGQKGWIKTLASVSVPTNPGPDSAAYGQGYMLYLAFGARPPDLRGGAGMFRYAGIGALANAQKVANWEYSGEGTLRRYVPDWPFRAVAPGSFASFDRDVKASVGSRRVPMWVSLYTASVKSNIGLPSWDASRTPGRRNVRLPKKPGQSTGDLSDYHGLNPGGHAISIVGYDEAASGYYYYVDTCWSGVDKYGAVGCRTGPYDRAVNYAGSSHPYTWRVPKVWLWDLVTEFGAGYLRYDGPASNRTAGW